MNDKPTYVFGLLLQNSAAASSVLRSLFRHPWVDNYRVDFGPPLVRSSEALIEQLRNAKDAIDKLSIYFDTCILNPQECRRLAEVQRKQVVRRLGPVEAEALAKASRQAIDLRLSLTPFLSARPDIQESMRKSGLDETNTSDVTREQLGAYFLIRLDDPRNARVFEMPEVRPEIASTEEAVFLELRTTVNARAYWKAFLETLSLVTSFQPIEIGDPRSWAKVTRDGRAL